MDSINRQLKYIKNVVSKDYLITKLNVNLGRYKKLVVYYSKNKHIQFGVPFVLFIVSGSFGLKYITNIRYKYRRVSEFQDSIKQSGIETRPAEALTIEAQYEEIKKLDIDNWENIRVPRPWKEEEDETK